MTSMDTDAVDREMRRYYRQRAPEYDEWYQRQGRYARGESDVRWHADVEAVGAWVAERRAKPVSVSGFGDERRLGQVLEIACGTGWWTRVLSRRNRLVGCDYSHEMLDQCRKACGVRGLQPPLVQGDAYLLPIAAHSVDAVFLGFFMSHVFPERMDDFVAEVTRVLRPGGEVWIVDSAWHVESGAVDHERYPDIRGGGVHERKLNDGSVHAVYKQCFDADGLSQLLCRWSDRRDVHASSEFFVWGRAVLP